MTDTLQTTPTPPAAANSAWEHAVERTRRRSPASFEQWFSSVQFDGLEGASLRLAARDEFVRDWVKAHFLPELLSHLAHGVEVEWRISGELERPVCEPRPPAPPVTAISRPVTSPPPRGDGEARSRSEAPRSDRAAAWRAELGAKLHVNQTFKNFVVGPSNELAYAAAVATAGGSGTRYNPLFICGGTGLGKTHLMNAIAHRVLAEQPTARVVYVSVEHFTNEFIEALQHRKMDEFRARYRTDCDYLLLDDIQFLAGRDQTQDEFFHTFNALRDSKKSIVVTSDKYPHQLQRMPERLISRFTSGLVADVQVPQLETRAAIVQNKAHLDGILIGDKVAVMLAQRVQSNVRELEGALVRLAAKASLIGRATIDNEFAEAELAAVAPRQQELVSMEDIQRAVCGHFRLSNAELLSKDRHKSIAFARQVAMYLCRQRLKSSFPELGRAFGNRDHTTVMSAVRRVEQLRQNDPQIDAHLEAIERRLASSED
ncbi:MAG: chromosomal replication initiator protein DnaA [Sorangiineae bacterium]|nr:chromosomal replication initiator protein DnaA [Polyangiaceae bacterium]MEB2321866.1 chromosomal replication initiator protein DnaA [Sorangiineae bacterium]